MYAEYDYGGAMLFFFLQIVWKNCGGNCTAHELRGLSNKYSFERSPHVMDIQTADCALRSKMGVKMRQEQRAKCPLFFLRF